MVISLQFRHTFLNVSLQDNENLIECTRKKNCVWNIHYYTLRIHSKTPIMGNHMFIILQIEQQTTCQLLQTTITSTVMKTKDQVESISIMGRRSMRNVFGWTLKCVHRPKDSFLLYFEKKMTIYLLLSQLYA